MSNKHRIFVAIYTQPTVTPGTSKHSFISTSTAERKDTPLSWGIWVEPKNSLGFGSSFDLEDHVGFSSVTNEFDWRLEIQDHQNIPKHMLGRIMIGKMPEAKTPRDLTRILRGVPLPSDYGSSVTDSESWVREAILYLQDAGMAERFMVDKFMVDAAAYGGQWLSKGVKYAEKANYTWGRSL